MCLARIVTSGMHVACIVSKFSSDISKTTVSTASGKVVLKLTSLLKFSMCVCDSVNFLFLFGFDECISIGSISGRSVSANRNVIMIVEERTPIKVSIDTLGILVTASSINLILRPCTFTFSEIL